MDGTALTSTYKVRAGTFEGPLELLLSLIEERKLFVNEISLASVTNDYIAYIKSLSSDTESARISQVSQFILIAATLILIKSKSLLPSLNLTDEETEKIGDLEKRLKLYQIIKNASIDVKDNFGTRIIFTPMERSYNDPLFSPDPAISIATISQSINEVINQIPKPKKEVLPEIEVKKIINIEQVIESLTERIQNAMNFSFKDFSRSHGAESVSEAKVHVIVSFLAMLELVREGIIDVVQNNSFEDININKRTEVVEENS